MTQSDAGCDNRLADEAMYFGAVADGVESQQEEIAELRQQLANALAANEHNLRVYHAAAAELRQQLSERDAEVKLLRDAIRFFMKAEGDYDLIEAGKKFTKALAGPEAGCGLGREAGI